MLPPCGCSVAAKLRTSYCIPLFPKTCHRKGVAPQHPSGRRSTSLRGKRDHRILVPASAHPAFREDPALRDPLEGFLEHLLSVGLEDEALARSPAARVDLVEEAGRKFPTVVVGMQLRTQIDVALCPPQRAKELPDVLRIGIAGDHRSD